MKMFSWENPHSKAVIFSSDFPCLITRGCVILNHPSTAILSLSYFMIREKPIMKNSICRYYKPESCSSGLAINLPISLVLQFMGHPGFARCDSSTRWALQKLWYIDHLICHKTILVSPINQLSRKKGPINVTLYNIYHMLPCIIRKISQGINSINLVGWSSSVTADPFLSHFDMSPRQKYCSDTKSTGTFNYPLVMTNSLPWYRWPIYAHRNRWSTWVYLLKMVIFHGYVK